MRDNEALDARAIDAGRAPVPPTDGGWQEPPIPTVKRRPVEEWGRAPSADAPPVTDWRGEQWRRERVPAARDPWGGSAPYGSPPADDRYDPYASDRWDQPAERRDGPADPYGDWRAESRAYEAVPPDQDRYREWSPEPAPARGWRGQP